jgi:glycerophosphoryl diester phosphodiesterase
MARKRKKKLRIFSHRGRGFQRKENDLSAFREVVLYPWIYGVELDVRFTYDGVPVLHHDPTFRFQGKELPIEDISYRERGFPLPTLYSALQILLPTHRIIVEVKPTLRPIRPLLELLSPYKKNLWISSFDFSILAQGKKFLPTLKRTLLRPEGATVHDLIKEGKKLVAEGIHLRYPTPREEVELLRREGFVVRFYNVETRTSLHDVWKLEVQDIMTDHPFLMKEEGERMGILF